MKHKSSKHRESHSRERKSSKRHRSKSIEKYRSKSKEEYRSINRKNDNKSSNKHYNDSSKHKERKKHKHSSKYDEDSSKKRKSNRSRSITPSRNDKLTKIKTELMEPIIKLEEIDSSKKQRKSRWSTNEYDKCVIPGMPTTLPANLRSDDAEIYVIQLQITDITNKLQKQNYTSEIEAMSRLSSPDPVYGPDGKRINTKEYRARERLEERKRQLMLKLHSLRPELVPQIDKIGGRYEEKVFIPQDDHPDINLIGLIIGPRGLTLKELEKEFGVKIIIRGKGSVHNGKISVNNSSLPGEDEPLHAYITSFSKENVDKAVNRINSIVNEGIEYPELENDLRKNQMKQLAILNGTYRETEGLNKLKMLSEAQTIITNTIICSLCGGTGHLPRDCKANYDSSIPQMVITQQSVLLDGEYNSFMTELGPEAQATGMPGYLGFTTIPPSSEPAAVNSFVRKFVFNS